MSNHNTPFSKGAIYRVLTDMVSCIREIVLDGNAVKIPNLANFLAVIKCKSADKFTAASNIKSVYLRSRSTGEFSRQELSKATKIQEAKEYSKGSDDNDSGNEGSGGTTNTGSGCSRSFSPSGNDSTGGTGDND